MVGSSQSIALSNIVLNTAIADVLGAIVNGLKGRRPSAPKCSPLWGIPTAPTSGSFLTATTIPRLGGRG
jgi:hypothetical protein